jgi:hypothetical protein
MRRRRRRSRQFVTLHPLLLFAPSLHVRTKPGLKLRYESKLEEVVVQTPHDGFPSSLHLIIRSSDGNAAPSQRSLCFDLIHQHEDGVGVQVRAVGQCEKHLRIATGRQGMLGKRDGQDCNP